MRVMYEKISAALIILVFSMIFGCLPLPMARRFKFSVPETSDQRAKKSHRKQMKNVLLAFLLNLGGGVLLANCFCHWLPEVREGLQNTDIDTKLPLAEVIMCCGFLFICLLEEAIHHFIHPHQRKKVAPDVGAKTEEPSADAHIEMRQVQGMKVMNTDASADEEGQEQGGAQVKSALRSVFVVLALSFHSTIEGMALALEEDSAGIWMNLGAVALHKFVIAFSVGVELVTNKVSTLSYLFSMLIFSIAPGLGVAAVLLMTELSASKTIDDLPLQILQGLATGTVVYVVFFEIFPKAKSTGGTGFQHVFAMTLGFAIFLPSLYFHSLSEGEGGGEVTEYPTSTSQPAASSMETATILTSATSYFLSTIV